MTETFSSLVTEISTPRWPRLLLQGDWELFSKGPILLLKSMKFLLRKVFWKGRDSYSGKSSSKTQDFCSKGSKLLHNKGLELLQNKGSKLLQKKVSSKGRKLLHNIEMNATQKCFKKTNGNPPRKLDPKIEMLITNSSSCFPPSSWAMNLSFYLKSKLIFFLITEMDEKNGGAYGLFILILPWMNIYIFWGGWLVSEANMVFLTWKFKFSSTRRSLGESKYSLERARSPLKYDVILFLSWCSIFHP